MTRREILANSNLLTFAGSESSANSTASLLFRIAADEILRAKLLQELRANFAKEDEISCGKAMALPYLTAVIEEGLRLHPVTPNALWRITPKQGNKILGDWLPGGVCSLPNLNKNRTDRLSTDGAQHPSSGGLSQRAQFQKSSRIHPRALDAAFRKIC
jgi:hypothetical protein